MSKSIKSRNANYWVCCKTNFYDFIFAIDYTQWFTKFKIANYLCLCQKMQTLHTKKCRAIISIFFRGKFSIMFFCRPVCVCTGYIDWYSSSFLLISIWFALAVTDSPTTPIETFYGGRGVGGGILTKWSKPILTKIAC